MSYIKKLRESKKILDAAQEALTQHDLLWAHIRELMIQGDLLVESARTLVDLHRQMMDNMDVAEVDIERDFDMPLQVVTSHGTYPVGVECPEHMIVHSNRGSWYICVPGGFIDVTGWHPGKVTK